MFSKVKDYKVLKTEYGHHAAEHSDFGYRIYDVGVDANAFYPISIEEIAENMNLK